MNAPMQRSVRGRALGVVAGTILLSVGLFAQTVAVAAMRPESSSSASPAPAVRAGTALADGTVSAHDNNFWIDNQPVTFRGLNVTPRTNTNTGVGASDFTRMGGWGMNFIRLRFHWADLEPNPPVQNADGTWTHAYDTTYMSSVEQAIAWARQNGLYTLIDNHPCGADDAPALCSYFGWPAWLYKASYNSHAKSYAQTIAGSLGAQTDFWSDTLRKGFMADMLRYVSNALDPVPGVAGYELLNEPQRGNLDGTHATTQMILDYQLSLGRLIRQQDPNRMLVFTTRAGFGPGLPLADLSGFTGLGNVAFDLHDYFGGRWGDGLNPSPTTGEDGEALQVLFDHVVDDHAGPYLGTTLGQIRFVQGALASLRTWGIPLLVGEVGDVGDDPGVYNYFGSAMSAFSYLGVSRTATYQGHLGITASDGTLLPWASLVINAA